MSRPSDSVCARVGDVRLQVVRIERPQGAFTPRSNSAMFLTLSNAGADDRLVGVDTVDARGRSSSERGRQRRPRA